MTDDHARTDSDDADQPNPAATVDERRAAEDRRADSTGGSAAEGTRRLTTVTPLGAPPSGANGPLSGPEAGRNGGAPPGDDLWRAREAPSAEDTWLAAVEEPAHASERPGDATSRGDAGQPGDGGPVGPEAGLVAPDGGPVGPEAGLVALDSGLGGPAPDDGTGGPGPAPGPSRRPAWYRVDELSVEQLVMRLLTLIGVGMAVVFVWLQLQPHLLLANTTPSGGDMGAHVWGPAFLRRALLPHLRLSGWTPDWYAGFPAYHFYMVVPSLLVLAVDAVPFVPYGVAFKLVTVSGLLAMPVAAWAMARLFGLRYPGPALLSFATLPFIFETRYTIYGGNAASTLAGEFAFSISLALVLVYLGVVAKGLDTGRYRAVAAGLFAAVLLCHLLPAIFAASATVVLVAWKLWPSWRSTVLWALPVGAVGVAIAGFWAVPFLTRHAYFNDMGWERTQTYFENLGPSKGNPTIWYAVFALAIVGAVLSLIERNVFGGFLTTLAVGSAIAFSAMPQGAFWNARVLPFYYLSLYLLAGLGVALFIGLVPSIGAQSLLATGAALTVLVVVGLPLGAVPGHHTPVNGKFELLGAKVTPSFVDDWARWNYTGYERKPAYPEYKALVDTMADVGRRDGCGRAMWEYQTEKLNSYGTPMALMLLPYWTKGCIGSMEGLYFESSATTPFHFLNQSELSEKPSSAQRKLPYRGFDIEMGVEHLQLMGVRYYMALSDRAKEAARGNKDLTYLRTSGPWDIFEVAHSELVTPLEYKPAVVSVGQSQTEWLPQATAFYNDPSRWAVPLAGDGPGNASNADPCAGDGWQRVAVDEQPARCPVTPATVSAIKAGTDTVSFDVDRVGSPVLVKVSYFPNWKVSGGKGPYRVTPNLMVVIPTANHVELHYGRTAVDWAGLALTLCGIAGLVLLARATPLVVKRRPAPLGPPEVPIDLSRYELFFPDAAPSDGDGVRPSLPSAPLGWAGDGPSPPSGSLPVSSLDGPATPPLPPLPPGPPRDRPGLVLDTPSGPAPAAPPSPGPVAPAPAAPPSPAWAPAPAAPGPAPTSSPALPPGASPAAPPSPAWAPAPAVPGPAPTLPPVATSPSSAVAAPPSPAAVPPVPAPTEGLAWAPPLGPSATTFVPPADASASGAAGPPAAEASPGLPEVPPPAAASGLQPSDDAWTERESSVPRPLHTEPEGLGPQLGQAPPGAPGDGEGR